MADSTPWIIAGVGIGIGIGLGVALLVQRRQVPVELGASQGQGQEQGLTIHDVIRDEQGRIETVETVRGVGAGASPGLHPQ